VIIRRVLANTYAYCLPACRRGRWCCPVGGNTSSSTAHWASVSDEDGYTAPRCSVTSRQRAGHEAYTMGDDHTSTSSRRAGSRSAASPRRIAGLGVGKGCGDRRGAASSRSRSAGARRIRSGSVGPGKGPVGSHRSGSCSTSTENATNRQSGEATRHLAWYGSGARVKSGSDNPGPPAVPATQLRNSGLSRTR